MYYVAAGQAFIFSLLIILYEVLHNRGIILSLLSAFFAALLPYIGASTVFIIRIRDAYMMYLTFSDMYRVTWLSWVLYAFFPLVLFLLTVQGRYVKAGKTNASNIWYRLLCRRSGVVRLMQAIVILSL